MHDANTPANQLTATPPPAVSEPPLDPILALVERVALNPDADIEKMRAVLDMQREVFERNAEIAYNSAMARVQAEVQTITKTKRNTHTNSWYADLGDIIEAIKPVYTREGFALSFGTLPGAPEGYMRMQCEVSHSGGHSKKFEADLPLDVAGAKGSSNKTGIQGWGSTSSYGRRYIQVMIFNIPMEDNDGNNQIPRKQKRTQHGECISKVQHDVLLDLIGKAGITVADFCAGVRVDALEDLHAARFEGAVKKLNKTIEAKGSKA